MAETTDPANSPSESPYKAGEQNGQHTAEPAAEPTFEMSKPAAEPTLPAADLTLPPIDISLPAMDNSLPHIDKTFPSIGSTKLPPIDSSLPSLPPIDTTLPPLDTTLPAVESGLPAIDTNFSFPDTRTTNMESSGPASTLPASGVPENNSFNQTSPSAPGPSYQSSSNGTYSQQPVQQQQQQPSESHYQQQHQPPQQYASPHQHSQPPQQQTQSQPQQTQQYQQQNPEMYHNSHSSTSMNAPSMQTMDHHHMPGQSSHIPQAPIGSPMPSNMPPMAGQYMTGYPTNVAQMGMNSNAQMRYQLPGDPNKMLSGGRHKKEVKRRTKTGCLTCRKRRIKCDEGHPVCRNCVKSKRECLGYDPVFKSPQAPSAIQPAPNPPPSLVVNPQDPTPSYPAAPPGYMPAASQPFAPSLHSESPSTSTEQQHYDYGAPIDPSLDENNSPNMASVQSATEGGLQPPVNPSTNTTTTPSEPSNFRVKQVQVNDLLALRGIPPPPPHPVTTLAPNRLEEIQAVFLATYAPAIDKFFETRWFSEKALTHLLANAQLMAEYSALIDAFNDRNLSDPNVVARLESFEASVVWNSVTLCRHVRNASSGTQDYDLLSSSARLDVIEAMITGEYLVSNPLAQFPTREPAANPPSLPDQLTQRSLDFWSAVGHFLTLHDNEASSAKEIDDTLARCRTLLDTYENRDVIYSIAIARHVGQRWADFPRSLPQPITTNEKDAGAKLYVAQKFLEEEAGGKGTTQVIRRICGMVVRSWIVSRE